MALGLSLTLLSACQYEAQPTQNISDDSAVTTEHSDSINTNTNYDDTTAVDTTTEVNNTVQQQSLPDSEFSEFKTLLQGSWERVSYPYDTIEFDGDQVKVTAGEGNIEPAKFETFKIADVCPNGIDGEASALAYDFLVIAGKRCNAIKLNNDTLSLTFAGADKATEFQRMNNTSVATSAAFNSIPSNFYGKWANGADNCSSKKAKQLTITADKLSFPDSTVQLVKIKQFEPTRLEADFDYSNDDGKSESYFYTLDLQNESKKLIIRENGSAPEQYNKCA